MTIKQQVVSGITAAAAMLILILDTPTAIRGAQEGIQLCLQTVIPSLFPFFLLANIVVSLLSGSRFSRLFRAFGSFCRMPQGAEGLLVIGCIGGYPVGARCIADAYSRGMLSFAQANRMLGFCCNAGPSFLFGMVSALFPSRSIVWLLWAIHLICAALIGHFLPEDSDCAPVNITPTQAYTWVSSMGQALRSMASVCGWVIIFRVVLAFLDRWIFWLLPEAYAALITGILELSNGCVQLGKIQNSGLRFALCAAFLGWGGVCVGMQTVSATEGLGTGLYFPAKALHGLISFVVAYLIQRFGFPAAHRFRMNDRFLWLVLAIVAGILINSIRRKNNSRNFEKARV